MLVQLLLLILLLLLINKLYRDYIFKYKFTNKFAINYKSNIIILYE